MVSFRLSAALAASCLAGNALASLDPIVAKGQYFFYSSNSSQFYIRGVAYQQGISGGGAGGTGYGSESNSATFIDPLADSTSCQRDIPYLQSLGTNAIRVYAIDPTADHDSCMKALDDAGIYVIADLSSPSEAINRANPQWTTDLYDRYTSVIKTMGQYNNVIGFFAGNEVTNNVTYTPSAAFVKAAVRDCKAYIKQNNIGNGRWLGVGYATNDDEDSRDHIAEYFNCGDASESVDFYGYNIYEWCGQQTFQTSGYQNRTEFFKSFNVPVFFAEYGCQTDGGAAKRIFQETGALYSSNMNTVWSGGIVYEYFEEQNDYGLVSVSGSSVQTLDDFNALQSQISASAYPSGVSQGSYNPSNSPAACPAIATDGPTAWAAKDSLPPTPNITTCDCMYQSQQCFPSRDVLANVSSIGSLFGTVCGLSNSACAGISANTVTGVYGPYGMCNSTQQLAYVLTEYYKSQNSAASACDFGGQAVLGNTSPSIAASCSPVLASASSAASNAATATSGSTGSSSSSAANPGSVGPFRWGFGAFDLFIGGYVLAAAGVGATMVLL